MDQSTMTTGVVVGALRESGGEQVNLQEAAAMGRDLLRSHGLDDWSFTFDRAKRRAGMCRFDQRTISLSRHLTQLHDAAQVRDTLLHEIAHAIAGPEAGHGPEWRAIAAEIGARPQRLLPSDVPLPPAPWQGHCPGGHEHRRFRRPARPLSCTRCCPRFCLAHLITWTRDGEPMDMPSEYRRSLADTAGRAARLPTCPACGRVPEAPHRAPKGLHAVPRSLHPEPESVLTVSRAIPQRPSGSHGDEQDAPVLLW